MRLPSLFSKAIFPMIAPSTPHPNPITNLPIFININDRPNVKIDVPRIENAIATNIGHLIECNLSAARLNKILNLKYSSFHLIG